MIEKIQELRMAAEAAMGKVNNEQGLRDFEIVYLGKKGELKDFAKNISKVDPSERKNFGQAVNALKRDIENSIELKAAEFEQKKMEALADNEWIDITAPAKDHMRKGGRHPLSSFIDEVNELFTELGFSHADGAEIESEWYNFTALNLDADHPAREMQDTFFVEELKANPLKFLSDDRDLGMVLRTQTSSMQIHYMQKNKPPLRVFVAGKVFRKESDATHAPVFHQVDCLLVDKNVSLRNLKGVLQEIFSKLLKKPDVKIRFRLSYFPFTEPSLEVDIGFELKGNKDYWLEIGGAGMVHPQVLKNAGLDPAEYNGFAFGMGIERMLMIRNNIKDLRLFFDNDIRFLKQFS
ncbi:phenylalanine--tRNA ligase subunit alpha [Candidatus Peregrinibacteria bacterium]|nr:MAG: phenylalanine--tRNA ligase subunit alpha [Candidatus Peregrinibacteria bacterium]